MKIVAVDNFANEAVADYLVAEGITVRRYAEAACKALNETFCNSECSPRHFLIKEDDYRLCRGMADLV